jgi:hypothetical protein
LPKNRRPGRVASANFLASFHANRVSGKWQATYQRQPLPPILRHRFLIQEMFAWPDLANFVPRHACLPMRRIVLSRYLRTCLKRCKSGRKVPILKTPAASTRTTTSPISSATCSGCGFPVPRDSAEACRPPEMTAAALLRLVASRPRRPPEGAVYCAEDSPKQACSTSDRRYVEH